MKGDVAQAREAFRVAGLVTAHAAVGDARQLPYASESRDAALLLGPLYHLPAESDRLRALREAWRVPRPGGRVVVAGISRFASLLDGFFHGFITDPDFVDIVKADLESGRHENPTENPAYFTTAYFHHPRELASQLGQAGFDDAEVLAVEGPFWCLPNFDDVWSSDELRDRMLTFLRQVEHEPTLIGASAHLLALARKTG